MEGYIKSEGVHVMSLHRKLRKSRTLGKETYRLPPPITYEYTLNLLSCVNWSLTESLSSHPIAEPEAASRTPTTGRSHSSWKTSKTSPVFTSRSSFRADPRPRSLYNQRIAKKSHLSLGTGKSVAQRFLPRGRDVIFICQKKVNLFSPPQTVGI